MPTQRYKLTVAYRGTRYHGWQQQAALPTYKGERQTDFGFVPETHREDEPLPADVVAPGVGPAPGADVDYIPTIQGELTKAVELAAAGTDIDYEGATGVELIGPGEARGSYRVYEITDDAAKTTGFR